MTKGTRIFKTRDGAGQKLSQLNTVVKVLWDNTNELQAFMPNLNTISVIHDKTIYDFTLFAPTVAGDHFGIMNHGEDSALLTG